MNNKEKNEAMLLDLLGQTELGDDIVGQVLGRFLQKSRDYDGAFFFLGVKGQFSDINRKFWKLKKALWDDEELHGEQAFEILEDFIGHALLTMWLLADGDLEES